MPRKEGGLLWPIPVVVANANAPRLGIAFPYALVVNGVPRPRANGGITPGAPMPFTIIQFTRRNKEKSVMNKM